MPRSTPQFSLTEALSELEAIERYFSTSTVDIEEGIRKYQRATELSKEVLNYLSKAKTTIEQLEVPTLHLPLAATDEG